jgi:D-serine deaminase-like pyridoxal phosphate-dependent protein
VISQTAQQEKVSIDVLLDIDCGQHRTGIEPGERAFELYKLISSLPGLRVPGCTRMTDTFMIAT